MNMQFFKLAALAIPLALTACVETTAPLCDASNLVDVPGLDRTYSTSFMFDPSQGVTTMQMTLAHTGLGQYTGGTPSATTSVCRLGNMTIAENRNADGNYSQSIVSVDPKAATTVSQLLINTADLVAGGVSFTLIERPTSSGQASKHKDPRAMFTQMIASAYGGQKILLIDNKSTQDRDVIMKAAKPSSIGFSLF